MVSGDTHPGQCLSNLLHAVKNEFIDLASDFADKFPNVPYYMLLIFEL
jgi:hypothetical protein